MSLESDYLGAFEEHSIEGVRRALASGASATLPIGGKTPIESLIEGYLRSSRFPDCLRILISAGAEIDPLLAALLLDDDVGLQGLRSKMSTATWDICIEVDTEQICRSEMYPMSTKLGVFGELLPV